MKTSESSRETLAQAAALVKQTSPGEWHYDETNMQVQRVLPDGTSRIVAELHGEDGWVPDGRFIAAAPHLIRQLLAALQQAQAATVNEGELFRMLSDALTGGNAGTWDEVVHAAEHVRNVVNMEQVVNKAQAAPAPAWQPIETAPKDGTNFLACSETNWVFYAHWANGLVDSTSFDEYGGGYQNRAATHWMPLPAAPGVAAAPPVAGTPEDQR